MATSKWERKPLGAVADLCLGKMLDQNKNRGQPLPYLANVNVRWGGFSLNGLRTMRFEPREMDRYALIKTQLAACRQLFISTHSFEFYNLIREWVADDDGKKHAEKPQANWKKWSVFYMKRTDPGNAVLEEIPMELLRFKSEYHYLFSTLYHFDKTGRADFDCLLSLPNVVRRFMEAFGGIMIPRRAGLQGKMPKLFPSDIERERVWKFINHYSHNTTITRSLTIPDTSECKAVVQACLKAVQDWDLDYFNDLETEVT